jgi:hypothetical protein
MSGTSTATFCLLASLTAGGCFYTTAPPRWLPRPEEAQREAHGGWMRVEYRVDSSVKVIEGELIAAATDSVYVLGPDTLVVLPTAAVSKGTLTAYDVGLDKLVMWTILGTLSTASHGYFLVLTGPLWILAGTASAASASKDPRVQSTDPPLIQKFARFPQGLPGDLDRRTLRRKDSNPDD